MYNAFIHHHLGGWRYPGRLAVPLVVGAAGALLGSATSPHYHYHSRVFISNLL